MNIGNRVHINLVAQYGAFAGLVVIAHIAGVSNGVTAAVYFWARVLHAVVMISGFGLFMARTVIFTVSVFSLLVFAWQIADAKLF